MKRLTVAALAVCALVYASVAPAQVVQAPVVKNSAGQNIGATPVITVDEFGEYVAGGGGGGAGTEFAEDSAHSSGADGTLVLGVRKDTAASLAGTDGDYTGFIFDNTGKLWVNAEITPAEGGSTEAKQDDLISAVGEVQATPTANTVLDRLKTLNVTVGETNTALGTIITNLGSPFQAGGSIGNTAFGISGAIPAGTNNIGDVDIATIAAGDNNIGNVDVASSALPTGAATEAKQPALGTAGSSSSDVLSVQGIASGTALPISAAALPLPSGAATEASVDGLEGALGAIDDAAWTSGSGSAIALLKAIAGAALDVTTPVPTNISTGTTRILSAAASTNLTEISDSACTIHTIQGINVDDSATFLKIYNVADGSVTVGTTTPAMTLALPASGPFALTINRAFGTACSMALTKAVADADTTALTAGDVVGLNVNWAP